MQGGFQTSERPRVATTHRRRPRTRGAHASCRAEGAPDVMPKSAWGPPMTHRASTRGLEGAGCSAPRPGRCAAMIRRWEKPYSGLPRYGSVVLGCFSGCSAEPSPGVEGPPVLHVARGLETACCVSQRRSHWFRRGGSDKCLGGVPGSVSRDARSLSPTVERRVDERSRALAIPAGGGHPLLPVTRAQ